jgi:hypothetical protein
MDQGAPETHLAATGCSGALMLGLHPIALARSGFSAQRLTKNRARRLALSVTLEN